MKKSKKFLSLLLVLALVVALAVPAFAAGGDLAGHTLVAYQIFKGTIATVDGEEVLGQVEWGDGINADAFLTALKQDGTIGKLFENVGSAEDEGSAKDVAGVLAGFGTDSAEAYAFARVAAANVNKGEGKAEGDKLDAGYYVVVDETTGKENEEGWAYNATLLQMVEGNTEFDPKDKVDVPTLEKKIEEDGSLVPATSVNVGDKVTFTITTTLPADFNDKNEYSEYEVKIYDTPATGLEIDKESWKVTYNDTTDATADWKLEEKDVGDDKTYIWTSPDLIDKGLTAGSKITLTYEAWVTKEILDNATVNQADNEAYLEFPNKPGTTEKGKTPDSKVTVFTFNVEVNKVKEDKTPLEGAEFTLYRETAQGAWEKVGKVTYGPNSTEFDPNSKNEDGTVFTFEGLKKGRYKLEETVVPAGYNKADDIYFEIVAEYNEDGSIKELKVVNGDTTLSDGEDATFTATMSEKEVSTNVVNVKGIHLPSTGGIGTTIFYVVGGLLIVGAGVVLITKKRMGSAE